MMIKLLKHRNCKFIIASALSILSACGTPSGQHQQSISQNNKPRLVTPSFDADSAYQYIETQVNFGPRVPNTPQHLLCASYLAQTLTRFGAEVIVQEAKVKAYNNTILDAHNIIGQFQPEKNDRILLFAHWDSRPYADHDPDPDKRNQPIDGANDGASGVGVLLEIARQLSQNPTYPGIDIIFFDAEDYGIPDHIEVSYKPDTWCLGSQYWAQNPHKKKYYARFGILLDMVGAPNAQFHKEQFSMQVAPRIVDNIWNIAGELGYSDWFNFETGGSITDDHIYVYKHLKIPSVDIIQHDPSSDTSFGYFWHTHDDTMKNINKETLKAVGQTIMEIIYREK